MVTVPDPAFEMDNTAIVFNKLRFGNWESWPGDEQKAIRQYFLASWKAFLRTSPDETGSTDAEDWLCGIAQAEDEMTPYLAIWESDKSVEAARHLSIVIVEHSFVQDDARPSDFWNKRKEQWSQVRQWLLSGSPQKTLKSVAAAQRDDRFDLAMQVLRVD
jgi:hypothetical protein